MFFDNTFTFFFYASRSNPSMASAAALVTGSSISRCSNPFSYCTDRFRSGWYTSSGEDENLALYARSDSVSSSLNIRPACRDDSTSTGRPWSRAAATRAIAGREAVGETTVWPELLLLFLPKSCCCDDDDDRDEVRLARIVFDRDRP